MAFALIFLLIALLVFGGLIVGIVLWTTSKGGSSSDMTCGKCGYGVRGLSQLSCPECGADLREVGIGRGGKPGQRTTGIVLTCICGAMVLLGCGLFTLALVGWNTASNSQSIQATQQRQAIPQPQLNQDPNATPVIENPESDTGETDR